MRKIIIDELIIPSRQIKDIEFFNDKVQICTMFEEKIITDPNKIFHIMDDSRIEHNSFAEWIDEFFGTGRALWFIDLLNEERAERLGSGQRHKIFLGHNKIEMLFHNTLKKHGEDIQDIYVHNGMVVVLAKGNKVIRTNIEYIRVKVKIGGFSEDEWISMTEYSEDNLNPLLHKELCNLTTKLKSIKEIRKKYLRR